jgi:hypothetical protein
MSLTVPNNKNQFALMANYGTALKDLLISRYSKRNLTTVVEEAPWLEHVTKQLTVKTWNIAFFFFRLQFM